MYKRIILIILDSVGLRAAEDAALFGDEGAGTLEHIYQTTNIRLPNLEMLGLGNLLKKENKEIAPQASYAVMIPQSAGKDTIAGHWEMMGVTLQHPLPVYKNGFPKQIIDEFCLRIGSGILGNKTASGTEIIKELGQLHKATGKPIIYTSADSVFQIAAHEEIIPVKRLYEICQTARDLLQGDHAVGRVIARPFIGEYPNYVRTKNRRDYALVPPADTTLDFLTEQGIPVYGVGKIEDIFAGRGITHSIHTANNKDGMNQIINTLKNDMQSGLLFANLVDFDSKYGHRRDVAGFAKALQEFDNWLPSLLQHICQDDLVMITADHGNDPTFRGSDHTRENTPMLMYGVKHSTYLGKRLFADIGATILHNFGLNVVNGIPFNLG